ncbi:hypothetical protein V2H45_09485 [Tumidithrix elongata RA019]|uniref:Uncharacterized protein n=1 Tax=Tumidithrix elongata BACA0141 TaxID=2716417 RepID=A0AAW9Q2X6_9CYAN|nr:hypothetical protein [Tumidithrix elongata RA019]
MARRYIQLNLLDLCHEEILPGRSNRSTKEPVRDRIVELLSPDLMPPSVAHAENGGSLKRKGNDSEQVRERPDEGLILTLEWCADASRGQMPADCFHVGDRVRILKHQFVQDKVGTIQKIELFHEALMLATIDFGLGENLWAISIRYLEPIEHETS